MRPVRSQSISVAAVRDSPAAPARAPAIVAVVGLLVAGAALAAGAAVQRRLFFVPASKSGGFPLWLAGPLHGIDHVLLPRAGAELLLAMFACYLVAVACAQALSIRVAIAAVVLAHVTFALAPPLFSADVFGYIDYARLGVLHGLDPYSHGAADAVRDPVTPFVRWHDIATPYGPLFTFVSSPLAWLSVPAALWVCKSLAALLSLACVALVWRIARRRGIEPVPAIVFVGLNPLLLAYGVGGAHNDFLLLALVLGAVLLVLEERPAGGGTVAALAVGIKASAGLVLPFLMLGAQPRRRAAVGACAGLAALLALAFAAFGGGALGFVSQIREQQQLVASQSVPSRLSAWLGFDAIPAGMRLAIGLAFAAVVLTLLWRAWRGRLDWLAGAGWATLALLLSTAWLVPWYVVWVLPLAAVGRDRRLSIATLLFCAYVVATRITYQLA
jgi:alpha-1,6-mannosyltransferase